MEKVEEVEKVEKNICESSVTCENNTAEDSLNIVQTSKFTDKLKMWYIDTKPTKNCVEKLLTILKEEGLDVPLSLETLLGRQKRALTKYVSPGIYCHFGIQKQIRKVESFLKNYEQIVIDVNIDGIPLFKSSLVQLWPILFKIVNTKEKFEPFPIGVFVGKGKPHSVHEFLEDFVEEVNHLDGYIVINNRNISMVLRCLVCDTPARSFACGVPGHTSCHGCMKCTQKAKKVNNVLTYCCTSGDPITDDDFFVRKYPEHHLRNFQQEMSPLESIGFKMISQTPLDSMHLIDLGVMKKMLLRLVNRQTRPKLPKVNVEKISTQLEQLKKFVPKEFPRKPRSLNEISNWKATEFRFFLAYSGPYVLQDIVDDDFYYEFLLLHCAYRMLNCPRHVANNIQQAQSLLELFVENFPIIFGEESVSFNVHSLLHIAEDVAKYGTLSEFAAYDFENRLQKLKKHVRKPTQIIQQIVNKERHETFIKEEKSGFVRCKEGIKGVYFNHCYFSYSSPNNICSVNLDTPIQIIGFVEGEHNIVEGRRILDIKSFYTEPLDSIQLGIFTSSMILAEKEQFPLKSLTYKYFCFPFKSEFALVPVLHSCL